MSASEVERTREAIRVAVSVAVFGDELSLRDSLPPLLAAFEAAVRAEEREACARIADGVCASDPDVIAGEIGHPPCCHASDIAAAIRGRGTT